MNGVLTLKIAATLALMGSNARAWDHTFQRGLDLYTVADGTIVVSIVCDPNSVYGTTESAVFIQTGADPFETKELTFWLADGVAIQVHLEKGRIAKALTEDLIWRTLLNGFRQFDTVVIEDGDESQYVILGDPMMLTCT